MCSFQVGDVFVVYVVDGVDNCVFMVDVVVCGVVVVLYQLDGLIDVLVVFVVFVVLVFDQFVGEIVSGWYGDLSDSLFVVGVMGMNGKMLCMQWIVIVLMVLYQLCVVIGMFGIGMFGQFVLIGFMIFDVL